MALDAGAGWRGNRLQPGRSGFDSHRRLCATAVWECINLVYGEFLLPLFIVSAKDRTAELLVARLLSIGPRKHAPCRCSASTRLPAASSSTTRIPFYSWPTRPGRWRRCLQRKIHSNHFCLGISFLVDRV